MLTTDPVDSTFNVAAGEVRSRGLDLNVTGNLTPEWRVIGGYAYVDAEVTKDNTLRSGTRLLNIPQNSFSLLNVYEFQDGTLKGLGLGTGVKYVDERAGQTANTAFSMGNYTVVDLLSFYKVNDNVRLNLDVKTCSTVITKRARSATSTPIRAHREPYRWGFPTRCKPGSAVASAP